MTFGSINMSDIEIKPSAQGDFSRTIIKENERPAEILKNLLNIPTVISDMEKLHKTLKLNKRITKKGLAPFVRLPLEFRQEQPGQEASFAFPLCGAVTALTAPQPRIEHIPHGIAEHIEGVDDNRQAQPRPERQP